MSKEEFLSSPKGSGVQHAFIHKDNFYDYELIKKVSLLTRPLCIIYIKSSHHQSLLYLPLRFHPAIEELLFTGSDDS